MGQYIVKESMRSANDINVTAYDFMVLFDTDLPSAMSTDAQTPFDWIAAACTACNVTIGTTRREAYQMPNGMRLLKFSNASADVKTWRDVVAQAAEAMGCNAMIGRDGKLYVRKYQAQFPDDSLTPGMRYSSDISDYQSYYTGIYLSYRDGGVQDYQRNTTEQFDTGLAYDLGFNSFLQISDDTNRHESMREIIGVMAGIKYTPFKVSLPFNPAYDLMDVIQFYGNQAASEDIAPITAITFRIGGKMDISCGGEDPSLQTAQSKVTKAIESMSSGSGYTDDFWMVIDSSPEAASTVIEADIPTKIGECLFYAKEALSMFEVNYTATYVLEKTSMIEVEVKVDDVVVYKTQENQWVGENRVTVTTGCETNTTGSHTVSIWITVTESTLDVGGGGVLRDLSITQNSIYQPEDYGVYGFRNVTAAVPDDYGYYGGALQLNVGSADVAASYEDEQSYQGSISYVQNPDFIDWVCRISEDIGDGATFNGRYFTRTDDSYPLLFVNFTGVSGYNSYGVISNHSEIPPQTYNSYGNLVDAGTLTDGGNTFHLFSMSGWWGISRDSIMYTVGNTATQFTGDGCYIRIDAQREGHIVALNSAIETEFKALLANFATMG